MSDVTRILSAIEQGDAHAAERSPPLVHDELRKLAAQRLAREKPGQSLPGTTLVREAYHRLVDMDRGRHGGLARRGHQEEQPADAAGRSGRGGPSGLTSPREPSRRRLGTVAARSCSNHAILAEFSCRKFHSVKRLKRDSRKTGET
jgi:hypothetical protein